MFKIMLEELRYCKRGSYQHDELLDIDTVEFRKDEGFKGINLEYETLEDAIEQAKIIYSRILPNVRRFILLSVIKSTDDDEYDLSYDEYYWDSDCLPLDYSYIKE